MYENIRSKLDSILNEVEGRGDDEFFTNLEMRIESCRVAGQHTRGAAISHTKKSLS